MADPRPTRSERTIYPRHYKRPISGETLERAKADERTRKEYDPDYMTAEEARALPAEVAQRPDVVARVRRSQPDWPENNASATKALGPLPTGNGEIVEERAVDTRSIFEGSKVDS